MQDHQKPLIPLQATTSTRVTGKQACYDQHKCKEHAACCPNLIVAVSEASGGCAIPKPEVSPRWNCTAQPILCTAAAPVCVFVCECVCFRLTDHAVVHGGSYC
eukprot:scaffold71367_cov21-Tisochrysis_lutea.AAC.4